MIFYWYLLSSLSFCINSFDAVYCIFQVGHDDSSLETVNLTRTSRGRIGLLLTESQDGVILVDDVVPGEPAAVQGNLKHGDRIVEVNILFFCRN